MTEQRIMVLPAEVVARVDENRGDITRSDFINILLDSLRFLWCGPYD